MNNDNSRNKIIFEDIRGENNIDTNDQSRPKISSAEEQMIRRILNENKVRLSSLKQRDDQQYLQE